MRAENFDKILDQIVEKDPRYHRDAYLFVREALDHTQRLAAKTVRGSAKQESRHVSGQELLAGIRTCALEQFGPMAFMVLEEWGVHRCEDFGEIVFNLIEYGGGMFGKSEKDSREDFKADWDFDEAFRQPFLPAAKKAQSPAETTT
jgi:uncharacterized repeat protein (TIGR04138 family)